MIRASLTVAAITALALGALLRNTAAAISTFVAVFIGRAPRTFSHTRNLARSLLPEMEGLGVAMIHQVGIDTVLERTMPRPTTDSLSAICNRCVQRCRPAGRLRPPACRHRPS